MELEALNKISSFKGAQSPSVLRLGRIYVIKEIRELSTKFGPKAILVLDDENEILHIFVPNRLNEPLLQRRHTFTPNTYGVINKGSRNNSIFLEFIELDSSSSKSSAHSSSSSASSQS